MIDTIACMIQLHDVVLSEGLFEGAHIVDDFGTQHVNVRLYRNPSDGQYEPRVTYWSTTGWLKVEFSVRKMLKQDINPSTAGVLIALDMVNNFVRRHFGVVVPVWEWKLQRIDYTWDFSVDNPDVYLHYLKNLRMSRFTSHPQKDGMLWKSGMRWVKFYRKDERTLRYEVSNYRNAIRDMAKRWFECERVVDPFVHAGRGLYVLAYFWDRLGLFDMRVSDVSQIVRLRACFGERVAWAYYVLKCLSEFGVDSYKRLDLMSSSQFYRYKNELREFGFVYFDDEDHVIVSDQSLPMLLLPIDDVLHDLSENLKASTTAGSLPLSKNFSEILGVSGSTKIPDKLRLHLDVFTI